MRYEWGICLASGMYDEWNGMGYFACLGEQWSFFDVL
jgi:hypothetical protein